MSQHIVKKGEGMDTSSTAKLSITTTFLSEVNSKGQVAINEYVFAMRCIKSGVAMGVVSHQCYILVLHPSSAFM